MPDKPKQINVNANAVIGTTFSQIASVTVTNMDVTFEFIYINPRAPQEGAVVSRVTMPKDTALELANSVITTIKKHDTKPKE